MSEKEANKIVAENRSGKGSVEMGGSAAQRRQIFEDILRVFLLDGVIDKREEKLITLVARHLKIDEKELAALKEKAKRVLANDKNEPQTPAEKSSRPVVSKPSAPLVAPGEMPPVTGTIHEKTGIEFLEISAGEFIFGNMSVGHLDENCQLPVFQMGKYAVTNQEWQRFEKDSGASGRVDYGPAFSRENQPVVGVSREDALAFCAWGGLRLPTEMEWERAARGIDGRLFPWGNQMPSPEMCNYGSSMFDESRPRTIEVGSNPQGVSPAGCFEMVGNVDEWCKNETLNPDGRVPVRGGHWLSAPYALNTYYHRLWEPGYRSNMVGFRVVAG